MIDTATNQVIGTGLQDTDTSSAQIAIVSVTDTPCAPDLARCSALMCTGDGNGDGAVTINEIMTAVNNVLNGCPVPPQ